MLKIGDNAPLDIEVLDINKNPVSLRHFKGEYIVLYFYPKDNTPGCTTEACNFRDLNDDIAELGANVVGVSKDGVESHKKFANKHNLNFELWSDTETKLIKAFKVWKKKSLFGKLSMGVARSTYVIDPEGKIIKIWNKVDPKNHAEEVYNFLKNEMSAK
jgi:thioredoxin-dependent peroxiredoxin